MNQILNESLGYLDMEHLIVPIVNIDKYKATVGKDSDVITVSFTVKDENAAEDFVNWFERGYNFVLDADRSPSEVAPHKYLVFVELERKKIPARHIIELIEDVKTLTGLPIDKWSLKVGDQKGDASVEFIENTVPLRSTEYKREHDDELNEWRNIAGVDKKEPSEKDESILAMQRQAGII